MQAWPAVLPNQEIARRLTAARILAGHPNRAKFAEALGLRNFGEGPVKQVEAGKRPLYEHERRAVAKLCDLPVEFFEVPRSQLGVVAAEPTPVEERLAEIERQIRDLAERATRQQQSEPERMADEAFAALDDASRTSPPQSTPEDQRSERKRPA